MIKKSISSFLIVALLFVIFPFTTSVSATTLDTAAVLDKLDSIKTDTYYDGLGQCYGFAKKIFATIYGLSSTDINWDYTKGTTSSDYLYLVTKTSSENGLSQLLGSAQAGDVLCYGGGGGNPHSMIFIGMDDENHGINVLDANWGTHNIISRHIITYAQMSSIVRNGNGVFLFRFTPTELSLNAESITLYIGAESEESTTQLTCIVTQDTYPAPVWSSSDDSIVTVSEDGTLTAVSPGTAVIACQIGDKMAQCEITVELKKISIVGVKNNRLTLIDILPDNAVSSGLEKPVILLPDAVNPLDDPLIK